MERSRNFIGRMLLSLTGNNKPIKRKPLKESSEAMALHCYNSLDGLYINKNYVSKVKGPAPVTESNAQNAK